MAGFNSQTDYFGLASASLICIESNTTPIPKSVEYAKDEDGYNVADGSYEAGPAVAVENTYELQSATLNLNTIALGYLLNGATKMVIEKVAATTGNNQWPQLVVSGYTDVINETTMPTFTLPSVTLTGIKQAQGLDFTVGASCRLTASNLDAECTLDHTLADDTTVGAMGISGATVSIGCTATEIDGVVTWTPDAAYEETQAPNAANGNINFGSASATAERFLAAD